MKKKGVSQISGIVKPTVGEKYMFHITGWYPDTEFEKRNPKEVTWELFKLRRNGDFTTTSIRKKGIGEFTFGEAALGHTYRLEAYLYAPEGGGLIINPQPGKIPKIGKVDFLYVDDTKGNNFSFMEKLTARAHCTGMLMKELVFTLWEDDAKGEGHNPNNKLIETRKARVNKSGIATAEFMLTKALIKKAMEGEFDVKELEFYVTVEYYASKKHTTDNVNVNNPFSPIKGEVKEDKSKTVPKAKRSPAASKPISKKEEKGILDNVKDWWEDFDLWDWGESSGIVKQEQKPTIEKLEGKSVSIVKEQQTSQSEKVCECEAKIRAFMRMIRIGEGTEDEGGYTRIVGGSSFADYEKDMSTHPKVYIKKYDSTAAGAYQITKTNWNSEGFVNWRNDNNITDFSKESQDIYCVYLIIKKKKAFNNINSDDIDGAITKCSKEWASLPGAGYGQREESREKIIEKYNGFLKQELEGSSNLHIKAGFLEKYFDIHCCKNSSIAEKQDFNDIIVEFDKNIEEERQKIVSEKTKNTLKKAAKTSGNKKVVITSTIRSPRKQAEAMYNNESNGRHIRYASPGRQVLDVYSQTKNQGREKTINAMVEKINELSKQGKRVSLHCVAESEYAKLNIIDISYIKGLTNYKKFILDLANDSSVLKIIHPIKNIGTSGKISYDDGEPAIHIEIKQ